jgi:Zn-dependent protease
MAERREWSLPIGRIAGVGIRVHVTFFLLVAVFALGSSGPQGPGLAAGLGWLALIFGCVLVHELAHSLLAQRRGATVHSIVLLPIGGVSRLEHVPEVWSDELEIAAVGPAASFLIAAAAACVALMLRVDLLPPALVAGGFLRRIVWFNLLIGAFNLVPAFPLDGGRVLRALLERRHDRETATRQAAMTGRVLAVGMAVVGLLWNVWLVLIAAFVYVGASVEERATVLHIRLRGLRVRDAMLLPGEFSHDEYAEILANRDAPVLTRDDPLEGEESALELFAETGAMALAVVENGEVVGLLTAHRVAQVAADRAALAAKGTGGDA